MAFNEKNVNLPLSDSERAILAHLKDPHASRNQRHMAETLGLHHQSVNRSLARLEHRGLVTMKRVAYREMKITDAGSEALKG